MEIAKCVSLFAPLRSRIAIGLVLVLVLDFVIVLRRMSSHLVEDEFECEDEDDFRSLKPLGGAVRPEPRRTHRAEVARKPRSRF